MFQLLNEQVRLSNHFQNFNGLLQAITSDPFSIGYIGTTFLDKEKMKPLAIDGVLPTYADIKARRYPIRNELQLLIRPNISKEAKDFIATLRLTHHQEEEKSNNENWTE